jgi:hypothetical protein
LHRASGRSEAEDGGARLFCFAMQSAPSAYGSCELPFGGARRKIVARRHCGAGPLAAKRRLSRRLAARPFPNGELLHDFTRLSAQPLADPIGQQHEARNVLREELDSDRRSDHIEAEQPQIIIEISEPG